MALKWLGQRVGLVLLTVPQLKLEVVPALQLVVLVVQVVLY
jgi:hypothetical protein